LAAKAVDQDERKWVMDALEDYQTNGSYQSSDLSKSILQGDKSHVGIIALLVFKFKLLRRWSGFTFASIGLRPEDVSEIQEHKQIHLTHFAKRSSNAGHCDRKRPSPLSYHHRGQLGKTARN
jgi:hypothetical protein